MKRCLFLLFLYYTLVVLSAPDLPPLESQETELKPFTAISNCLPFNLLVEPTDSDEDAYTLVIEAEEALLDVIDARVRNEVLTLGLSDGFETERVIRVTVRMPKNKLDTITMSSTALLVVSPGLNVKDLTIMATGVAAVRVFDAKIKDLVVRGDGSSIVFVEGRIKRARFDVQGTSRVYAYGVRSEAEVFADGIGRAFIQAAKEDVRITGSVEGLGRVFITDGICSVRGTVFRSGCETIDINALPQFEAPFSCGLIVDGEIACSRRGRSSTYTSSRLDGGSASTFSSSSGGSGSATSSVSRGSGSSTSSVSRGSTSSSSSVSSSASARSTRGGTFSSTAFSSSSAGGAGDHRFESLVSTEGGEDGSAVAVAATTCLDEDVSMFSDT